MYNDDDAPRHQRPSCHARDCSRTQAMRASHGLPAPSASLLRFLRCQLSVQSPTPCASSTSSAIPSRQCRAFSSTTERPALRPYNSNAASTLTVRAPTSKPSSRRSSSTSKPSSISTQPHRSLSTTPVLREGFWRRLRKAPRATTAERFRDNGLLPFQDLLDDLTKKPTVPNLPELGTDDVAPDTLLDYLLAP